MLKKIFKYIILPLLTIVILWATYFFAYGNFHKVDKDVYRSAQLFDFNLPYYLKKHKIKSILNLRSMRKAKKLKRKWYVDEVSISKELNVVRYDYPIGDREEASIEEMETIIKLMKNAPKPLLIHCKMGADRTSLASALYLYSSTSSKSPERAISIVYGHFPWLGSKTIAMDRSYKKYILFKKDIY